MRESWLYQEIKAEGRTEGFAAGLAQGLAEAFTNGMRRAVLVQATHRFGPPDAVEKARLEAITGVEQLERIGLAVLTASGWDELLAKPLRRRRRR